MFAKDENKNREILKCADLEKVWILCGLLQGLNVCGKYK